MANKPKDKGTAYESSLVKCFNSWVGDTVAERIVLHGNRDYGDIRLMVDDYKLCVEAKYRKSYPTESEMAAFRYQTIVETSNSESDGGILVVNHFNQNIFRSEVWMTHQTFIDLIGLDVLVGHSEHDWNCKTLLEFNWLCFGAPAWGMEELN